MKTKTITLPVEVWETILDTMDSHQDSGPVGEGWASDELKEARAALHKALDQ